MNYSDWEKQVTTYMNLLQSVSNNPPVIDLGIDGNLTSPLVWASIFDDFAAQFLDARNNIR